MLHNICTEIIYGVVNAGRLTNNSARSLKSSNDEEVISKFNVQEDSCILLRSVCTRNRLLHSSIMPHPRRKIITYGFGCNHRSIDYHGLICVVTEVYCLCVKDISFLNTRISCHIYSDTKGKFAIEYVNLEQWRLYWVYLPDIKKWTSYNQMIS